MSQHDKCHIDPAEVKKAATRLAPFIHNTPIFRSDTLDHLLGHEILFKCDIFQKTGAFKVRGALNKLLQLKEKNNLPQHVVTFSSGNHSQAIAYSTNLLNIKSTIFLPENVSSIKLQATKRFNSEVIVTKTRQEAEAQAELMAKQGSLLIPPFDDEEVMIGQGTAIYETLSEVSNVNAIFTPIGGGGLVSGSYLAKELLSPQSKIFACEPLAANDAARSLREGEIFAFTTPPQTIADGARTLKIGKKTFPFLNKIDGVLEIPEEEIIYWTQWISHLLKIIVEPTSILSMAGAVQWLKQQNSKQKVVVMLSGGNISPESYKNIWQQNHLTKIPHI